MFTAEPILGHEQGHWQVIYETGGQDLPWCETASADKAWMTAAALNRYEQGGAMVREDSEKP
jgi:hypothetical protein